MRYKIVMDYYAVFEDSTIINTKTNKMIKKTYSDTRKTPVTVKLAGRSYTLARIVYNAFADKPLADNEIVRYKDNDIMNCSFSNLLKISKREYRESKAKKKLDDTTAKQIRQEYLVENLGHKGNMTYKELSKKYGVSLSVISRIVNGSYFESNSTNRKKAQDEKEKQDKLVNTYLSYMHS